MKHFLVFLLLISCLVAACNTEVKVSDTCGDGFLDPGEECDGADLGGLDCLAVGGHDPDAQLSCDADCTIDRASCGSYCGDGTVDVEHGETCDNDNLNGQTCLTLGWHGGDLSCGEDCRLHALDCEAHGQCGDGVVQSDFEECDGDDLFGNSCDSNGFTAGMISCADDCTLDTSACTTCGDGVIESGEQCEGTDLGGSSCADLGFDYGDLACDGACRLDTTGCVISTCGNGVIDPGEDCEPPANLNGKTCVTQGFVSGTLTCNANCTFNLSNCGMCGNNAVDAGENCDGTDLGGQSCTTLGYTAGSISCNANCTISTGACTTCGNAIIENGEQCDGVNHNGQTCVSQGFFTGSLACGASCLFDTTGCTNCGNGVIDSGEDCDDGNLGGADCTDAGFPGGTVACDDATCAFNPAGCWKWTRIAAGASHTCALRSNGTVGCWGDGGYGQLGRNSLTDSAIPVTVSNLSNATEILSGDYHSCAITSTGELHCWGRNNYGQLGAGNTTDYKIPVQVLSSVSKADGGSFHTCAISTSGAVNCWGYNRFGRLGTGNETDSHTPTQILSSGGAWISAGGSHTCLVKTDGSAWCWGANADGQLGDDTNTNRLVPTQVYGLTSNVSLVTAGNAHTCAIYVSTNTAYISCWGRNTYGQLGIGNTTDKVRPTLVSSLSRSITGISAGNAHTCAKKGLYGVYCWGLNSSGQLGIGNTTNKTSPQLISNTIGYNYISNGANHTCAIGGNYAYCWGANASGQLGDDGNLNSTSPSQVH